MIHVPAGAFTMGSTHRKDEQPIRHVYLNEFWISKFPVTVSEYRAHCVALGLDLMSDQQNAWVFNGMYENHPIMNLNWFEARQYCRWAGGDLPTEAQWDKAARGTDGRIYPWGNEWNPSVVIHDEKGNFGSYKSRPVGQYPDSASFYGVQDLVGGPKEWCLDWYSLEYSATDLLNPVGPMSGNWRALRGGCVRNRVGSFRCSKRVISSPEYRMVAGFRLVKNSVA